METGGLHDCQVRQDTHRNVVLPGSLFFYPLYCFFQSLGHKIQSSITFASKQGDKDKCQERALALRPCLSQNSLMTLPLGILIPNLLSSSWSIRLSI